MCFYRKDPYFYYSDFIMLFPSILFFFALVFVSTSVFIIFFCSFSERSLFCLQRLSAVLIRPLDLLGRSVGSQKTWEEWSTRCHTVVDRAHLLEKLGCRL